MTTTRQKKKYPPQHHLFEECEDHENHMCFLVQNRKMDKVFELAKDAHVICQMCGRTASSGANLCSPVKMTED
jgi:hypothetical protein